MDKDFFDTLSPAEKLEWRKQDIEAELRRTEIRAGVWKIALGTCIVGVAAALFPAVQSASKVYFEFLAEERRLSLESNRSEQVRRVENRQFLESLAGEGRSANLDKRIILAEYYVYLSEDEAEKTRWKAFHTHLTELQTAKRDAVLKAAALSVDPEADPKEVAEAKANAQLLSASAEPGLIAQTAVPVPASFGELLEQLSSDDAETRRKARTELAQLRTALVRPAMSVLSEASALSYRQELGLVVALTEMMRANKSQRVTIAELMTLADLETLLRASAHTDRSIRIHAGEFLFDLGDPRVFEVVPDLWAELNSDNGRFNFALAMKGAAPHVRAENKARAEEILTGYLGVVGPKTDELLTDALRFLQS